MPKKSSKNLPIYEYDKKVNGQTRYYIRPYVNGKQTTYRLDENGNMWLGRDGYQQACSYYGEISSKKDTLSYDPNTYFTEVIDKTIEETKKSCKYSSYYTFKNDVNNHIKPFFQKYRLKDLNSQIFCKWHDYILNKQLSRETCNKLHIWLSKICEVSIKFFGMDSNYERQVGTFEKSVDEREMITDENEHIRYITLEQFNEFISNVDDFMWNTFFTFLFYTGMRKGEVLALTWEDIDLVNKKISVTKTLSREIVDGKKKSTSTKTGETRIVDISKILLEQLQKYYQYVNPKQNEYVFGGEEPLALSTIDRYKQHYFSLCNVPEITIHEFRHSHVSMLINEAVKRNMDVGAFFVMMSERMGHTIEVMQETYMHLFPDVQAPIVDMLDSL